MCDSGAVRKNPRIDGEGMRRSAGHHGYAETERSVSVGFCFVDWSLIGEQ